MYTPSHFRQNPTDTLHALMRPYPFASVIDGLRPHDGDGDMELTALMAAQAPTS